MPETELQEITFDPPAPEQPMLINPDVWVDLVMRDKLAREEQRRQFYRIKRRNRPRIVAAQKPLLCLSCLFGQHRKCAENGCPCVHRDCTREKAAPQVEETENYCWPV